MPFPRFYSGQIDQTDFAPNFVLPNANIAVASLGPGKIGKLAVNRTGSTIPAGALVFINSFDAATNLGSINLAAAQFQSERAQYVAQAAIPNNGTGQIGVSMTLTGQNTNAGNVGDPIWLSGSVLGGYTLTKPSAANTVAQLVGHITIKSATVGAVLIELFEAMVPIAFGSNELQNGSVGAAALTANLQGERPEVSTGVIGTAAATYECAVIIAKNGTVGGFRLAFLQALAASDTNFVTLSVNNRTQSLLMTSAAGAGVNSTKVTGGAAIVQYAPYLLAVNGTPANLIVAAGDVLTLSAVVTGTLPNTVAGTFSVGMGPS